MFLNFIMGVDANCCRRPGLGKKELNTNRGIQQRRNEDFRSFDEQDDFRVYNQGFNQNSNEYLNSIYSNNVYSTTPFQDYSNTTEQISEPIIYSNQLTYPLIQNQEVNYQSDFQTNQYTNSYTDISGDNNIQFSDNYQSNQYIQSQNDYTIENYNNYEQTFSNNYISSEPFQYNNSLSNEYSNNQPFEFTDMQNIVSNDYFPTTSSQPSEYYTSNQNNYIENNQSQPTYIEEPKISNQYSDFQTDYTSSPTYSTEYLSSNSGFQDNQYEEEPTQYNIPRPQYTEYPQQNHYIEEKPIIKRVYLSKPLHNLEPQTQVQQTMYSPSQEDYPEMQRGPEQLNLSDYRPKDQEKYTDINENFNESFDEGNKIKDDDRENENEEKQDDNDPFSERIKSSVVEKKKESTACKVPGFISNFISKLF